MRRYRVLCYGFYQGMIQLLPHIMQTSGDFVKQMHLWRLLSLWFGTELLMSVKCFKIHVFIQTKICCFSLFIPSISILSGWWCESQDLSFKGVFL